MHSLIIEIREKNKLKVEPLKENDVYDLMEHIVDYVVEGTERDSQWFESFMKETIGIEIKNATMALEKDFYKKFIEKKLIKLQEMVKENFKTVENYFSNKWALEELLNDTHGMYFIKNGCYYTFDEFFERPHLSGKEYKIVKIFNYHF